MDNVALAWRNHLFLILLIVFTPSAFASAPLNAIDAFKTIMIDGSDIEGVVSQPIDQYSLAAIIDDEMEPIPFQIDEYNIGGAVYFEGWDVPIAGSVGVFDPEDKLLFIYKDAGSRREPRHKYDGEIIHEITLTNSSGEKHYAYLVKGSRLRSDEQYIRYSIEEALVETDFYSITYSKDNHINWDDFSIVNYEGEENPFDAFKIRLQTGVITALAKIQLNNEDMVATPKGEHFGPVRSTTQLELIVWFFKVPFMRMSIQLHHSPNSLLYDVRANIPSARRKVLTDPSVHLSLEGNGLYGTEIRTASGPVEPAVTDGKVDETEKQHIDSGVSIDRNWIWATTKRNLDFAAFFNYSGEQQQEISFFYNDEAGVVDLPERFPGQLPNAGYKIHSLPDEGYFGAAIAVHFSNGYKGLPELFTDQLRRLPDIYIKAAVGSK